MHVNLKPDTQSCRAFHLAAENFPYPGYFPRVRLHQKLIVNLKDEAAFEPFLPQPSVSTDHRDLDDISSSPLDRGVHSNTLPKGTSHKVGFPQFDDAMYGENCPYEMPPASYKLTHRLSDGHGVYSFCMCPGGYVVNASSEEGRLAVNGMSYQTRDSENANSAIVVTVSPEDILKNLEPEKCKGTFSPDDPLIGMYFQRTLEEKAFLEGGGTIPVQRFEDFCKNRPSEQSGSIAPQIRGAFSFANVRRILPEETACGIEEGIFAWERQVSGFSCGDALLAGIESRTSSPVRIERGEDYQAEGYKGVYPCGEGAGYAGGITSAAVDGLKVAEAILSASEKDSLSQSAGRTAGLSGEPAGEQAGTSVQD